MRAQVRNHLSLVRLDQLECSYRTAIVMLGRGGPLARHRHGVHIWRMAAYARAWLMRRAGAEQSDLLELAAPCGMGKIGIPDHITQEPGPSPRWIIVRSHPRIGYGSWAIRCPIFMAAEICTTTKWDGSGFIPLARPVGIPGRRG